MRKLLILILLILPLAVFSQTIPLGVIASQGGIVASFPSILTNAKTAANAADSTAHHAVMPSGVQVGDLLVALVASDGAVTISVNTVYSGNNWTIEDQGTHTTTVTGAVVWKIAEGGDKLSLTTSASEKTNIQVFRISGVKSADPMTVTKADGNDASPNPPSDSPAYGSQKYLWLVIHAGDTDDGYSTAAPANFGNLDVTRTALIGTTCSLSTAYREFETDLAYDPGVFTAFVSDDWVCFTVIINPN